MIEYARNVAGIADAGHAEYDPETPNPLIVPVACPVDDRPAGEPRLSGRLHITVEPGTLAERVLDRSAIDEEFTCSFELHHDAEAALTAAGLVVSGRGGQGEARMVELPNRRFYLAGLFLPQLSSSEEAPHPLITAFLTAARQFRDDRREGPRRTT